MVLTKTHPVVFFFFSMLNLGEKENERDGDGKGEKKEEGGEDRVIEG